MIFLERLTDAQKIQILDSTKILKKILGIDFHQGLYLKKNPPMRVQSKNILLANFLQIRIRILKTFFAKGSFALSKLNRLQNVELIFVL